MVKSISSIIPNHLLTGNIPFYLILFLVIIGVSWLIGTNIVNIVDKKLSNISINMPNITLPTPNFTIHMDDKKNPIMIGGGFTENHYTYYKNPSQLTERQIDKFKEKAKFNRMTLQDYKNWLGLFSNNIYELSKRDPLCVLHYGKCIENRLTDDDLKSIQTTTNSNNKIVKPFTPDISYHSL